MLKRQAVIVLMFLLVQEGIGGNVEVFNLAVKPREVMIEGCRDNDAWGMRDVLASVPLRQITDEEILQSLFKQSAPTASAADRIFIQEQVQIVLSVGNERFKTVGFGRCFFNG